MEPLRQAPRRLRLAAKIRRDLAAGRPVADPLFDELYSHECHDQSATHWTPVAVVQAALGLLRPTADLRLLDIGSGCGKFCLAAALSGPGLFTGIELRSRLAEEARDLQALLGADRASFLQGDAFHLDWSGYNAFYLYNPFHENILPAGERRTRWIDTDIGLGEPRFRACVAALISRLGDCPAGTRVLTYHGFGGSPPAAYRRQALLPSGSGDLELWVKSS